MSSKSLTQILDDHDHRHHHDDGECTPCGHRHPVFNVGLAMLGGVLVVNSWLAEWLFFKDDPVVGTICAILGALVLSYPIFRTAVTDIAEGNFQMNELVALAILAAFVMGSYQEAGIVAFFMLITIVIEEKTAIGAKEAIAGLVSMTPSSGFRINKDGSESEVPVSELEVGQLIRVRPGQNFPVDGVIVRGASTVNQASITGESLPVEKAIDDEVYAGTENLNGAVDVRVTRLGEDTTLGQVRDLILAAEKTRLPIMRLIDQYMIYYTPTVLTIAAIVWFFTADLMRVVLILVMACPCALVLANPSAVVAAIAAAARLGMLIKNVVQIETAATINAVVFDKTGTLTEGNLSVARLQPSEGVELADLLSAAVCAESRSNHPAAVALRKLAADANITWDEPEEVEEVAGRGVIAKSASGCIRVGRGSWLKENGIEPAETGDDTVGMSIVQVARGEQVLGWVGLRDSARAEAKEAIEQLRGLGVKLCSMVTGDNASVAQLVSERVGIDDISSECLPQDKVAYVEALKARGATVAVVGDGVNDAPALASGDISIAMGAIGSDIALNSASIALMNNDLRRVPALIDLSRRTRIVIQQNLAVGCVVIMGGLMLFIFGDSSLNHFAEGIGMRPSVLKVIIAAALHNIGTLAVLFNSARLFRFGERMSDSAAESAAEAALTPADVSV
jgi:Cd2+/Zn2+-exporting ATPase